MAAESLAKPVQHLSGIAQEYVPALTKLGLLRGVDLLFHFPRSYQAAAESLTPTEFKPNLLVSFPAIIREVDERITQNGKSILGALVEVVTGNSQAADQPTFVRLLWFNQSYRRRDLVIGQGLQISGRLKSAGLTWEIVHPQTSPLDEQAESAFDFSKPQPVYPLCEGIKQSQLRRIMAQQIPALLSDVQEVLPQNLRIRLDVPDIATALHAIHLPSDEADHAMARRRFKLQELLVLQLALAMQKSNRERDAIAPVCEANGKIHARILNRLGFVLTGDQASAIEDIGRDMAREIPMNRLLQGDVGSGKTVVAQYAMLLSVAHGFQAALMAPTEILALQHAATLEKSLASSRVRIALLTGSLKTAERREVLAKLAAGEYDLVVGTQALLSADVEFANLGLVIVDEQHKFGVLQRAKLRSDGKLPHYLVLSATPIPRTVAMTMFGDLDISCIREKPPGRAAVHTYTAQAADLESWWKFVDDKLASGRQAFVIAPRIEEKEDTNIASAEGVYAELCKGRFAHRRLGLLHGRQAPEEKASVLTAFANGDLDMLVSTTVVEVGIDVSNATVMTILNADRLGLSQLHQLRGRVSRGGHPGYVCAVNVQSDESIHPRLEAFRKSNDGFELAEMDLKLRGPGDLLGTVQSGLPPFRIASLIDDAELLDLAREVAYELLAQDPQLDAADLQLLKKQTLNRYGSSLQLSDVG